MSKPIEYEFKLNKEKLTEHFIEQIVEFLNNCGQFDIKVLFNMRPIRNYRLTIKHKGIMNPDVKAELESLITFLVEQIADLKMRELNIETEEKA